MKNGAGSTLVFVLDFFVGHEKGAHHLLSLSPIKNPLLHKSADIVDNHLSLRQLDLAHHLILGVLDVLEQRRIRPLNRAADLLLPGNRAAVGLVNSDFGERSVVEFLVREWGGLRRLFGGLCCGFRSV